MPKFIVVALFLLTSCTTGESEKAKNAIFFIIDGMGPAHITGARIYNKDSNTPLSMERMTHLAMARTHSSNDFVTDSAASATALSCGVKTYNGAIGMSDPDLDPSGESQKLECVAPKAQAAGKAVGIVTNTRITHATPAAFLTHVPHRRLEADIALQISQSDVDLIVGGGIEFFLPKEEGGERSDGLNLIEKMKERGYRVVVTHDDFRALDPKIDQKIFAILEEDHLAYEADRESDEISLREITDFSIQYLKNRSKNGYFLMVESGRVDHASHRNEARRTFEDMIEADRSIERALKERNDTLIVVTADHETGGLALSGYAPISVAAGEGILKNQVRDMRTDSYTYGLVSWASGPGFDSPLSVDEDERHFRHKATYPAPFAHHTAVDVPTLAEGPGAELINGFIDNTEIIKVIEAVLEL